MTDTLPEVTWEEAYWELFLRHAELWTLVAQMVLDD